MNKLQASLILVSISVLFGCSTPLDKTVLEQLTVEELAQVMDGDTLFGDVYDAVSTIRDSVLIKPSDQVTWSELTYNDLLDYAKLLRDTAFYKENETIASIRWESSYKPVLFEVDSLAAVWLERKAVWKLENDPNSYLKITPVNIETDYYEYSYGVKDVHVKFQFKPLKGPLEQCTFAYGVFPVSSEIEELLMRAETLGEYLSSSTTDLLRAKCIHSSRITKTKYGRYEVPYSYETVLSGETVASLTEGYDFIIRVSSIRKDGETIDGDGFEIPSSIKSYVRFRDFSDSTDFYTQAENGFSPIYTDDVAMEMLDKKYIDQWEVTSQIQDSILMERFELAHDFIRLLP